MSFKTAKFATGAARQHVLKSLGILALATAGFSIDLVKADAVTLAWDPNPETNITGYQLRYGTSPGVYPGVINAGPNTSAAVSGLTQGTTYYFVVSAINQASLESMPSSEVSYLVPVAPVNSAPIATSLSVTTAQGTPVPVTLSGTDVDRNPLTFAIVSGPANGTLGGTAPNLTYSPAANFSGADQFTFVVNDGTVNSAAATVSITVTPANNAPVATSRSVTTAQGTPVPVTLAGTDVDGNPLTFAIVSGPANGTLGGTAPNLTYSPAANFSGADQFTFVVNDGTVNSAAATVSITVTPANNAPVATSRSVTTAQGTPVPVTLAGTDVDGNPLTFAIVSGPANGTLGGTAPNLTYSPAANFSGADQFTFVVNDGTVNSAAATVSITITPANSLPLPWNAYQIGTSNLAGTASFSGGVYTIAGSGALGGNQDAANFSWQTLSGDGEIIARISKLSDTGSATRVGVMIRESLAANSRMAFIGFNGVAKCLWQSRTSTGGTTATLTTRAKQGALPWLRLVRKGGTITASRSNDAISWTDLGTYTVALPANCYIGLSVSSGSNTLLNTSQFSDVRITP